MQRTFILSMTIKTARTTVLLNIHYIVAHTHTLEEILCHVVDYVGTIGYYASVEQGLSGCREDYLLPPS